MDIANIVMRNHEKYRLMEAEQRSTDAMFAEAIESHKMASNPAKWAYKRIGEYIAEFERDLDDDHEIGANIVSFGGSIIIHIEEIGYYGPDIITFNGIAQDGNRVQLIQNLSQINVLLVAVKKIHEKPCRIGYLWADESE